MPLNATTKARFIIAGLEVNVYELERSQLSVVYAKKRGPVVSGAFSIATEAPDDSGLPHCLEHLIFLGSDKYPYKGILDIAANRSFAKGTNAWTATDHTAYTLRNAGADGFCNVAPCLLDHVLNPKLTDDGYITEVHHINGEGQDGGVVYCELEGRETAAEELSAITLSRAMFPDGCGYRYESGGTMEAVRHLCSPERVREFHNSMYHPSGIVLVVVGHLPDEHLDALLSRLDSVVPDEKLPRNRPRVAWTRPSPAFSSSQFRDIAFPSDDESTGMVQLGWQVTEYNDFFSHTALDVITDYLTDNATSPLQRDLVELDDPYAGGADFSMDDFDKRVLDLTLDSVPAERLDDVEGKALEVLKGIADGKEEIDMQMLRTLIERSRLDFLEKVENDANDLVPAMAIPHFIYGGGQWQGMQEAFDELTRLETLKEKGPEFWRTLVKEMLVDRPRVTVICRPSKEKGEEIRKDEEQRVEERKRQLGEEELKRRKSRIDTAHERNDAPFDPSLVTEHFPVPPVDGIDRHDVTMSGLGPMTSLRARDPNSKLPVPAILADVESAFVSTGILMRCDGLTPRQRQLLPLLMSLMFESGVERDGTFVGHEQIAQEVAEASVSTEATVGFSGESFFSAGPFTCARVEIRTETKKYHQCVSLIADCLFRMRATKSRLVALANKALNKAPKVLREGECIALDLLDDINFIEGSLRRSTNAMRQKVFLKELVRQLKKGDASAIISEMDELRRELISEDRLLIFVNGKLNHLEPHLESAWLDALQHLPGKRLPNDAHFPKPNSTFLSDVGRSGGKGVICGVSSVESGYLELSGPAVDAWTHADVAPVLVAAEMLQALEGPFWREIRGNGYAYGAHLSLKIEQGLLCFNLYRSNQVGKALTVTKSIIDGFATGNKPLTEVDVENAISSTIYGITAKEQTPTDAGRQAMLNMVKRLPADHNMHLIHRVRAVTRADVERALHAYFVPLFEFQASNVAICCNPAKVDSIIEEFGALGVKLEEMNSLEAAFGCKN